MLRIGFEPQEVGCFAVVVVIVVLLKKSSKGLGQVGIKLVVVVVVVEQLFNLSFISQYFSSNFCKTTVNVSPYSMPVHSRFSPVYTTESVLSQLFNTVLLQELLG
jgi:hypothetical protein